MGKVRNKRQFYGQLKINQSTILSRLFLKNHLLINGWGGQQGKERQRRGVFDFSYSYFPVLILIDFFSIIANDEAYDEDAKDAADLVINKKSHLQTMIELSISCQNLPKLDFLSQTDAKIVVYKEEGFDYFSC